MLAYILKEKYIWLKKQKKENFINKTKITIKINLEKLYLKYDYFSVIFAGIIAPILALIIVSFLTAIVVLPISWLMGWTSFTL